MAPSFLVSRIRENTNIKGISVNSVEIEFTGYANDTTLILDRSCECLVEKLSASGRQIFIMRDANINLLSYKWCKFAQEFLCHLQSYSFIPTIHKPSATLIDNIFINNDDANVQSGNILSDISDHYT